MNTYKPQAEKWKPLLPPFHPPKLPKKPPTRKSPPEQKSLFQIKETHHQ